MQTVSVVRCTRRLKICWPCDVVRSLAPVKTVLTATDGKCAFGILKPSRYYLTTDDEKGSLSDWFGFEVKGPPNPNESEIIDIPPVYRDCTGVSVDSSGEVLVYSGHHASLGPMLRNFLPGAVLLAMIVASFVVLFLGWTSRGGDRRGRVALVSAKGNSAGWPFRRHSSGPFVHGAVDALSSVPSFAVTICQVGACPALHRSSMHLLGTTATTMVADSVGGFSPDRELVFSSC
jgi:hypothetical protein